MIIKLLELFKTAFVVESYKDKTFQHQIIRKTAVRGIPFILSIMIVEFIMILVSFFSAELFYEDYTWIFRLHYIALFCVSLLSVLITKYFLNKDQNNDFPIYVTLTFLTVFSISWSASITLIDQIFSPQISVYLTFIVLIAMGAIFTPRRMFIIYGSIHLTFLLLAPIYQPDIKLLFSTRLNSSLFILFAWIIARQLYAEHYQIYLKDKLIASQYKKLKESNEQLTTISQRDALTQLYNRYSLNTLLEVEWQEITNSQEKLNVLMIDIDNFKPFNDTYGHIKGDECIVAVGLLLKEVVTKYNGKAFRYGGDEFCLIFRGYSVNDLGQIINNIHERVMDLTIDIHLSIGAYSGDSSQHDSPWALIDLADYDLYEQKASK